MTPCRKAVLLFAKRITLFAKIVILFAKRTMPLAKTVEFLTKRAEEFAHLAEHFLTSGPVAVKATTMANNFSQQKDSTLIAIQTQLAGIVHVTNDFGITSDELANLSISKSAMTTAAESQQSARAMEKAATQDKMAAKAALVAALNAVATTVYANPAVTDGMLASISFAPRRAGTSRPQAATGVTGLSAEAFANGTVKLAWDRSGNRASTIFVVEASADGRAWSQVFSTTRVSATLPGYAPGEATWFRVTAKNSAGTAIPSAPVSIYAPAAAPVTLRLAA